MAGLLHLLKASMLLSNYGFYMQSQEIHTPMGKHIGVR
jgi:hypothetical protein